MVVIDDDVVLFLALCLGADEPVAVQNRFLHVITIESLC